jgi:predicted deacylase
MNGAALTNFTKAGKSGLIVESGGGARVREEDFANFRVALNGICQALGMLPGTPPSAQDVRYGGNAVHLKTRRGGFWHPLVAPGDDVSEGQPLGEMVDIFGEVAETTTCSFKRAWIGSIRRPFMPLYAGDQIIELVESLPAP